MSATAESEKFSTYFANALRTPGSYSDCFDIVPCISVSGRTFPVKSFFLEDAIENSGK